MKRLVAIVVFALVAVTGAWAQNYPTRPVVLIVPFPPGGLSDAVGRPGWHFFSLHHMKLILQEILGVLLGLLAEIHYVKCVVVGIIGIDAIGC